VFPPVARTAYDWGCNETREDAIAKAMALAGNDYPVAVYKRASLDMSSDDYWKFSLDYVV